MSTLRSLVSLLSENKCENCSETNKNAIGEPESDLIDRNELEIVQIVTVEAHGTVIKLLQMVWDEMKNDRNVCEFADKKNHNCKIMKKLEYSYLSQPCHNPILVNDLSSTSAIQKALLTVRNSSLESSEYFSTSVLITHRLVPGLVPVSFIVEEKEARRYLINACTQFFIQYDSFERDMQDNSHENIENNSGIGRENSSEDIAEIKTKMSKKNIKRIRKTISNIKTTITKKGSDTKFLNNITKEVDLFMKKYFKSYSLTHILRLLLDHLEAKKETNLIKNTNQAIVSKDLTYLESVLMVVLVNNKKFADIVKNVQKIIGNQTINSEDVEKIKLGSKSDKNRTDQKSNKAQSNVSSQTNSKMSQKNKIKEEKNKKIEEFFNPSSLSDFSILLSLNKLISYSFVKRTRDSYTLAVSEEAVQAVGERIGFDVKREMELQ